MSPICVFDCQRNKRFAIFTAPIMEINDCEIAFHILTLSSSEFIALSVILAVE